MGEDRWHKNYYTGEFKNGRYEGNGLLLKNTYLMKGLFRKAHLWRGEVRYENHLGGAILVKKKMNGRTSSREFIKKADFRKLGIQTDFVKDTFTKEGWSLLYQYEDSLKEIKLRDLRDKASMKITIKAQKQDPVNQTRIEEIIGKISSKTYKIFSSASIFGKVVYDKEAIATYSTMNFKGFIIDEYRMGHGTMVFYNGETYEGNFFANLKHGEGTYKWPNGDRYVGSYVMNKMCGFGSLDFMDKYRYEGEF